MQRPFASFASVLLVFAFARAEEGKWNPQQILQFEPAALHRMGLKLPLSRLWDPARGTGLLAAAVPNSYPAGRFCCFRLSTSEERVICPATARPPFQPVGHKP